MPVSTVERDVKSRSLVLRMENGYTEEGNTIYVSKSFSNLRAGALDADIFNSANVLAGLQNKPVYDIEILERNSLRI